MDKACDTNISPTTLPNGVPPRLLWWTLLSVPLSILPFFFGLFSWSIILSALLLGCLAFIDVLRLAAKPNAQPLPFVFVSVSFMFFWIGSLKQFDSDSKFALAGQGAGLAILMSIWLEYYFREAIAKLRASSMSEGKEV